MIYSPFLMHRVELKVPTLQTMGSPDSCMVPNAPCGVESRAIFTARFSIDLTVPNAPCGVESLLEKQTLLSQSSSVPNAPCGVERQMKRDLHSEEQPRS